MIYARPSSIVGMANAMSTMLFIVILYVYSSFAHAQAGTVSLPSAEGQPISIALNALPDDAITGNLADYLSVFVGIKNQCCEQLTPIAGHYYHDETRAYFKPYFEFVKGQSYVVKTKEITPAQKLKTHLNEFMLTAATPKAVKVMKIQPNSALIPENTLRFYLYFTQPMKPNVAFNYIKLVNAEGVEDNAAFMKFKQELWSADRKRLTLLMDPGRIKRGVETNLELGPALEAGKAYKIIVKAGWPTANGNQTLAGFSHSYQINNALRTLPDVNKWKITPPKIGSLQPLRIQFDRLFDYQLLQSEISLFSSDGNEISGKISNDEEHQIWQFTPKKQWRNKHIVLSVNAKLEDVAGNNFKDVMDHPVGDKMHKIDSVERHIALD
ncbi:hypothetical protein [Marinomonas pollencensis]|uniref:SbsA Ig-like domain-containing protein n=1 Tax=Marinomonas pollencensis TaxID=491954 RepID=A0A3E0DRC0_9GAMM|nr:hypothetical protein [Marinomonas pollencensis]REG85650.1 hypothetical protein DFP81_102183 [Marinomonas pollencensis]